MNIRRAVLKVVIFVFVCGQVVSAEQKNQSNLSVIKLAIPAPTDSAGGIIAADVDNDNKMDYLVTVPGHLAVYGNDGKKLWIKKRK